MYILLLLQKVQRIKSCPSNALRQFRRRCNYNCNKLAEKKKQQHSPPFLTQRWMTFIAEILINKKKEFYLKSFNEKWFDFILFYNLQYIWYLHYSKVRIKVNNMWWPIKETPLSIQIPYDGVIVQSNTRSTIILIWGIEIRSWQLLCTVSNLPLWYLNSLQLIWCLQWKSHSIAFIFSTYHSRIKNLQVWYYFINF